MVPPNSFQRCRGRGQSVEVVRPLVGIKEVVAQEFENVAVELVGARFQAHVDHAAQEVAVFCAGVVGDHVEFLDGVHAGRIGDVVVDELVVIHTVQHVVVGLFAVAVDVRPRRIERLLPRVEGSRADGERAGDQQRQLVIVAGLERQAGDFVRSHHGAHLRGLCLQHRRSGRDFELLRDWSDRHGDVDSGRLVQHQLERLAHRRLEPRGLDPQLVAADGQPGQVVGAFHIRLRLEGRPAIYVPGRYRGAG